MIDLKLLRENPDFFKKAVNRKRASVDIDKILDLDKKNRKLIPQIEEMRASQRKMGDEIIALSKKEKEEKILKMQKTKQEIKDLETELEIFSKELIKNLALIPNPSFEWVPDGGEENNVTLREIGDKTVFNFKPKNYIELAEKLNLIDTERAAKVSGSRFGYILGMAARLETALMNFVFD